MSHWFKPLLYAMTGTCSLVAAVASSITLASWASEVGNDSPGGSRQWITIVGKACEQQGTLPSESDFTCRFQAMLRLQEGVIEIQTGARNGRRTIHSAIDAQWVPIADMAIVDHDFPDMWRVSAYRNAMMGVWTLAGLGSFLAYFCLRRALRWATEESAQASEA